MQKISKENLPLGVLLSENCLLVDAIQKLNQIALQILLVVDNDGKLIGTLTDGDIRRAILDNKNMKCSVSDICNRNPKYVNSNSRDEAIRLMQEFGISRVPIVDNSRRPIGLYKIEDIVANRLISKNTVVVIMAGGKGTRLLPITKIIPKALVPVKGKAIIETIIDSFFSQGFKKFVISINYKKEFIKSYFKEIEEIINYEIKYIEEEGFLGTAGSLGELAGHVNEAFFLSNCDIIVNANYNSVLEFHKENSLDLTIISALQKIDVPYGVINTENGNFKSIEEKPSLHFLVNTGVYVLEPGILRLIPKNTKFDMTDLIKAALKENMKIGTFPAHNGWIDIGDSYKSIEIMNTE